MIRILLPPGQLVSQDISITGDQARHLALVLRTQPGDHITVLDGQGYKYECRILTVRKKDIQAKIISKSSYSAESQISITLAQGIAKGDKMDLIIQKSTELGITKIIPLITERSQVRHTEKTERWRKIALSASQQSGREKIPVIEEAIEFEKFILNITKVVIPAKVYDPWVTTHRAGIQKERKMDSPVKPENDRLSNTSAENTCLQIIFSEEHKGENLKKILTEPWNYQNIVLLIGPEGGFSPEEVRLAVQQGFLKASLGPRILRTETAPIAAMSIIQYELGDIG